MDIAALIKHPDQLDRETLYDLRSLLALYPYYQTARLLLLQNLYLLHDPSFNDELKRAAIYITDRKVIFNLVEAAHYQHKALTQNKERQETATAEDKSQRTISLIDSFLETIPEEKDSTPKPKRRPTTADAAIDYVSYLLAMEDEENANAPSNTTQESTPQLRGQNLIDNFLNSGPAKLTLKDEPVYKPEISMPEENCEDDAKNGYFTEKLAKIYIKQGRYDKALEIIQRINLNNTKKSAYFADQIRFLEKLILNNKYK